MIYPNCITVTCLPPITGFDKCAFCDLTHFLTVFFLGCLTLVIPIVIFPPKVCCQITIENISHNPVPGTGLLYQLFMFLDL